MGVDGNKKKLEIVQDRMKEARSLLLWQLLTTRAVLDLQT